MDALLSMSWLVALYVFMLAAFTGSQTVRDLLRALVECLHNGWPHELHGEPRQNEEHNELGEQCCVQIHGNQSSVKVD